MKKFCGQINFEDDFSKIWANFERSIIFWEYFEKFWKKIWRNFKVNIVGKFWRKIRRKGLEHFKNILMKIMKRLRSNFKGNFGKFWKLLRKIFDKYGMSKLIIKKFWREMRRKYWNFRGLWRKFWKTGIGRNFVENLKKRPISPKEYLRKLWRNMENTWLRIFKKIILKNYKKILRKSKKRLRIFKETVNKFFVRFVGNLEKFCRKYDETSTNFRRKSEVEETLKNHCKFSKNMFINFW